jgi:hypothetical protein
MNRAEYKKNLEQKLIRQFIENFYKKIGYRPVVILEDGKNNDGSILLTLSELDKYFEPFLPTLYQKRLSLPAKDRIRPLVELRCIFAFIARSMNYTLKAIGTHLGGRDHTTVINNIDCFKNLYETDDSFRNRYFAIINNIKKDYEPSIMDDTNQIQGEPQSDLLPRLLQGEDTTIQ